MHFADGEVCTVLLRTKHAQSIRKCIPAPQLSLHRAVEREVTICVILCHVELQNDDQISGNRGRQLNGNEGDPIHFLGSIF